MLCLQAFIYYNTSEGIIDYVQVTRDGFDIFSIKIYNANTVLTVLPLPWLHKSDPTSHQPSEDFRKIIKRDKAHYNILEENKQCDKWRRSTKTTDKCYCCEEVLDPSYKSSTSEEKNLFAEK